MTRPIKSLSIDQSSSTGPGRSVRSKGHPNILLFVIARNLDSANDTLTVEVEHSPDGDTWDSILSLSQSDIEGGTATVFESDVPVDEVRAHITEFNDASGDDLSVDAFVQAGGSSGSAYKFRET